jgi:molybdopterin-guanine dinucleotide biosynthesis protein A
MTGRIGAIVLAGGRSSRFGRDKLAEPLDGRPLLHHAISAVRDLTDRIVVVAGPVDEPRLPDGVRLVHDDRPFEGPLAALAVGLAETDPGVERVIVIGGDMPSLVPAVLGRLLAALGPDSTAAILGVDGPRAILPLALAVGPARTAVNGLVSAGERRLGALLDVLDVDVVPAASWRSDDPGGLTLRDIDSPDDLWSERSRR